jgi:TolC family type I secretion outer membrane protein
LVTTARASSVEPPRRAHFPAGARARALRRRLAAAVSGIAVAAVLAGTPMPAAAETLREALAQAYRTNPNLEAARRELGATNEQVPQARSGWRPSVNVRGQVGRERTDSEFEGSGNPRFGSQQGGGEYTTPWSTSLEVRQPLYRGGSTIAGIDRAEDQVRAQRARLAATEQDILFRAAQAYIDVWRAQAVLRLNENNVEVLRRQLEATQDRFEVGEVTRTDVAQAESRLAGAVADRTDAQGQLNASRATYKEVVGRMPEDLEQPPQPESLPGSLQAAVAQARENNPQVRAARFAYEAARDQTREVAGQLLPRADLVGELSYAEEQQGSGSSTEAAEVRAEVTIPLYQQGQVFSQVREIKQVANQRRLELRAARNTAEEQAVSSWEDLQAARAQIESLEERVRAQEIALEGVRQENQVGARTVLDVLDAEQELLNAQVALVRAQRNEIVAAYGVLRAVGKLDARTIGLDVQVFEPERNYEQVDGKWFGWGLPEEQAAQREGDTDAGDATGQPTDVTDGNGG